MKHKINQLIILTAIILNLLIINLPVTAQTEAKAENNLAQQYQRLASNGKVLQISTDLAFEQVNFYYADALETIEKDALSKDLENGLLQAFDKTAAALELEKDENSRGVLSANLVYLVTGLRLLLPDTDQRLKTVNQRITGLLISSDLRTIVDETKLVLAAKDLKESPVLGYTEDYTQYTREVAIPRHRNKPVIFGR